MITFDGIFTFLSLQPPMHYRPKNLLFIGCFFFALNALFAQTQTLRGRVSEDLSEKPIASVNIVLLPDNQGISTDAKGNYRIENVKTGRHQLKISAIGYETVLLSELLVESGKEVIMDVKLRIGTTEIPQIVIAADQNSREIAPTSQLITIEQVLRYPATFNDPARLAAFLPGVASDNDAANHISIRGNSPNSMSWRIENAEIVNPNHLTNAGTASDLPVQNGGGVNVLSAQMLGTTRFLAGAMPAGYGNSVAGLFDMRLRNGNNEKLEGVVQLGLIGLEAALEGPISKKNGSSFLMNYRYSTVGLLAKMGVPLGDETTDFQDFAATLNFPTKKMGTFKPFFVIGESHNYHAALKSELWKDDKDSKEIEFNSAMGILGIKHTLNLNKNLAWTTTAAFSTNQSWRIQRIFPITTFHDLYKGMQKTSLHTAFSQVLSTTQTLNFGAQLTAQHQWYQSSIIIDAAQVRASELLLQPYMNWEKRWTSRFQTVLGMQFSNYFVANQQHYNQEPRLSAQYRIADNQKISVSLASQSKIIPSIQPESEVLVHFYPQYGYLKSYNMDINYTYTTNSGHQWQINPFYQWLNGAPITKQGDSFLNFYDGTTVFNTKELKNTGNNYGISFQLRKYLDQNYYYLLNTTLLNSTYKAENGNTYPTRWQRPYIFNATGGKEWAFNKKLTHILGVNLHVVTMAGALTNAVDEVASKSSLINTIYDYKNPYSIRLKDYFRTDLRIYWKRNRTHYNSMLSLDIQNATNRLNEQYLYYEHRAQKTTIKTQLGLLPILSYRVEI
jgi:CarboxypepD_reg-like domain